MKRSAPLPVAWLIVMLELVVTALLLVASNPIAAGADPAAPRRTRHTTPMRIREIIRGCGGKPFFNVPPRSW
jgi:hypothetical protein